MRLSLQEAIMKVAFVMAERSTCSRRNNGAVIVDSKGVVLSTGYNGSLSGMPHCDHECSCEDEFIVEKLIGSDEIVSNGEIHSESCPAHPNNGCTTAVHAEANAVYFAARNGVSVKGSTIFCTTEPCTKCAEAIVQSGISGVLYDQEYRDHSGIELLQDADVCVMRVNVKN
jgi:dCMP deaminase